MQRLLLLFLMLLLLSSGRHSDNEEQVILDRIEYIYNLKRTIDTSVCKGFADKKFDLPLIYYTANSLRCQSDKTLYCFLYPKAGI
jgi:hypothetical protein